MNIIVSTSEAQKSFYPTPSPLASELVSGIEWGKIQNVLEPSAGNGNLIHAVLEKAYLYTNSLSVDCVEIDPSLRAILTFEFGAENKCNLHDRCRELEKLYRGGRTGNDGLTPDQREEFGIIRAKLSRLEAGEVRIVHDNFLTFSSRKRYDLIIMNPPFSEGDKHLVKAISLVEPYGGEIRCLLNAETIRNPYTNLRKVLNQKLADLGATITYKSEVFANAERATLVDVALVKISIPTPDYASDPDSLFNRMKKARRETMESVEDPTELVETDKFKQAVTMFQFEVDAGLRLIREYRAMQPYIMSSLDKSSKYDKPLLQLLAHGQHSSDEIPDPNKFIRGVRLKYWKGLLDNKAFTGKLTSNLQDKYRGMLEDLVEYDFTEYNIRTLYTQMNSEMVAAVEGTIVKLFDDMSVRFSYYPETQKNIYLYNGWKTNKAHRVNFPKVIMPVYGLFSDYSWDKPFVLNKATEILSDIEKVFNYLDGNMTAPCNLHTALETAHSSGQTKNIRCKFFTVTFYKKGTMHLVFHDRNLIDRFNIYCSQKKNWLPPDYGTHKYENMSEESKAVVDSFHGDGTTGSGQKGYEAVLIRANYFLAPPAQYSAMPQLTE